MKRTLLTVLFLAAAATASNAQCVRTGVYYASYNSQTMDAYGQFVFSTIQTSGYANMMGNSCVNVTHIPKVYNYLKNLNTGQVAGGQYYSGPAGCPSCQIFVSNTITMSVMPNVPTFFQGTIGSQVYCSVAGLFWSWPNIEFDMEVAVTKSKVIGGSVGAWLLAPWCTAATYPPDFTPSIYFGREPNPQYTLGDAICVSSNFLSNGWHCTPGPAVVQTDTTKYACTKMPPVH